MNYGTLAALSSLTQKYILFSMVNFDRLMLVRAAGDFEQWVTFFLKTILWSSEYALEKIKQILLLQKTVKERLMHEKSATIRTLQLLDTLFFSPLFTINDIATKLQISYQGAKDQVSLFLKLGMVEELTGQKRSKRYAFQEYLQIVEQ